MSKIAAKENLLDLFKAAHAAGRTFFSVEFIPGTTPQLRKSLQESIKALATCPPLFASVTWHNSHKTTTDGTSESDIDHPALELADELQSKHKINTCLHLAAGDLKKSQVLCILYRALRIGVRNILALRGDPEPNPGSDFHRGVDLVRFIREKFGTEFTLAVAGYPTTGQLDQRYRQGLLHLKEKVDAGADFVITQVIFRAKDFLSFLDDCQTLGINVPIIPGLLVTEMQASMTSLERMAILTKTDVPSDIKEKVANMQNDPKAQRAFIQNLSLTTAQELVDSNKTPGIHFFTINRFADYSNLGPNQQSSQELPGTSLESYPALATVPMHNRKEIDF